MQSNANVGQALRRPTPAERFYGAILGRLATDGQIAVPEDGFDGYLRRRFKPKAGDAYTVAVSLRSIGKLQYEESCLLIDYFGLKFDSCSTKVQIAKRHGVPVSVINRQIIAAEDKILENHELMTWLQDYHPEAWPS